jgi:eukaryotic-like serine/threonine-protein kinase
MARHESEFDTMVAPSIEPESSEMSHEETDSLFAGRYQILALLGSGGMGSVYQARDTELDEVVALKMLRRDMIRSAGVVELFRREVKLARKVTHPNVARTFDIGESNGARYLTMEFIEGTSLRNIMDRAETLSFEDVTKFGVAICAGLSAAHAVGVVHRDLKPDNVLVSREGRIVITDFGIARPAEPGNASITVGVAVGTPAYMAPEQVEARRDVDARVDIYALGVLLFEATTGVLPFQGDTALALAAARLIQTPPHVRTLRSDTPITLAEVIERCLARDRDARYATASDVALALSGVGGTPLTTQRLTHIDASPETKTIAVLRFRNSGSAQDQHVVDGLWDDLIDSLSMTRGLRVRPRGAAAAYTGDDRDPCDVGRSMGVEAVVEGSVRGGSEGIRVSARVLSVSDGFQLWAKRFERSTRDLFTLSDDIASAVADALAVERLIPKRAALESDAMNLYLRGREEYRRGYGMGIEKSVELFRQAAALAPNDPMVLAALATSQCRRWFFGRENAFEEAVSSATKAAHIAPHLPEARHAIALLDLHRGNYQLALSTLIDVVKSTNHLLSHETLCSICQEVGLMNEMRFHVDEALRIDPQSSFALFELGRYYALEGRWDAYDGIQARLADAHDPRILNDAARLSVRMALWRGNIDGAREKLRSAELGPVTTDLAMAMSDLDSPAETVRAAFEGVRASGGSVRRLALMFQIEAEYASIRNDPAWVIETLDRAKDSALIDEAWLDKCPLLSSARALPNFEAVALPIRERAEELRTFVRKLEPMKVR